ncbi:MAG: 30S ribosome-binding factor RbfA [Anaerovoracaceae bacterium]|nr:30S ribosome-binding factor RbfA [Anaerovoracaceae bacterium]
MGRSYRPGRLGEEIKKIISDMLLRELKDPRIDGLVSVTDVEVSGDSGYATVYITVISTDPGLPPDKQALMKRDVLEGLDSAKGLIKREINKKIKLRKIPELTFKSDDSFEYGSHMEEVLDRVMKEDGNDEK